MTDEEIAALKAENEALKEENEALKEANFFGVPKELRTLVAEKRAAGLDLKTALESAKNQVAWDQQQKKDAAEAKERERERKKQETANA